LLTHFTNKQYLETVDLFYELLFALSVPTVCVTGGGAGWDNA